MSKRFGNWVKFDEMVWPLDMPGLEWALRYDTPTKQELLAAASVLAAYKAAIYSTQKKRNFVFKELQKHSVEREKGLKNDEN